MKLALAVSLVTIFTVLVLLPTHASARDTSRSACFNAVQIQLWNDAFNRFSLIKQQPFLDKPSSLSVDASRFFEHPKIISLVKGKSLNVEQLKAMQRYEVGLNISSFIQEYVEYRNDLAEEETLYRIDCVDNELQRFRAVLEKERKGVVLADNSDYWNRRRNSPKNWTVDHHENAAILFILKEEALNSIRKKIALRQKRDFRGFKSRLGATGLPWTPNLK